MKLFYKIDNLKLHVCTFIYIYISWMFILYFMNTIINMYILYI